MAVSPTVRIAVTGARGPQGERGLASGPLGAESVGAAEIDGDDVVAIREKLDVPEIADVANKLDRDIGTPSTEAANLTALNAAITASPVRRVDLKGGTFNLGSSPTNSLGVPLKNGKVLVPSGIASFKTQVNSYAPDVNGLLVGREHLMTWWRSLNAETFQTIPIYGDSTVEMSVAYPLTSEKLFKRALMAAGINHCIPVNKGDSGTSWSDLDALPDLGAGVKLAIFKYAINDAVKSSPLSTMAADMRSKLSAIRADPDGGYESLSILLMGPSSTFAPSHNQDAKWFEDVRNLYIQVAHEFGCAYVDTYAYLQDTSQAPGFWLDDLSAAPGYYPGEGLHPDPQAVYAIWLEMLWSELLGNGGYNIAKSNFHFNVHHSTEQHYPTDEPQTYPPGIHQYGALNSDGMPYDGQMLVHRQANGDVIQSIHTLDQVPRKATRNGTGLLWTPWTGVPVLIGGGGTAPAFANTWANKGGGFKAAGYITTDDGWVEFFGSVAPGTSGSAAWQMPAGLRPTETWSFDVVGGTVEVFADGNVIITVTGSTHVRLGGIRYRPL